MTPAPSAVPLTAEPFTAAELADQFLMGFVSPRALATIQAAHDEIARLINVQNELTAERDAARADTAANAKWGMTFFDGGVAWLKRAWVAEAERDALAERVKLTTEALRPFSEASISDAMIKAGLSMAGKVHGIAPPASYVKGIFLKMYQVMLAQV